MDFIFDYYKADSGEVSDQEHIAFVTFWFSHFVFCTSSLQVTKKFIAKAIQLDEGQKFYLIRLILGNLFQSLGYGRQVMQRPDQGKVVLIFGSIWLFQL